MEKLKKPPSNRQREAIWLFVNPISCNQRVYFLSIKIGMLAEIVIGHFGENVDQTRTKSRS